MARIGILGGTFDPPHLGHIALAENAIKELSLDNLLFIPSRIPPHKPQTKISPGDDRYAMLKLAIEGYPDLDITDMELKRVGKSYTYDTILELNKTYPDDEMFFIIGADNIQDMENWYKPDELISLINFIAANRPGFEPSGRFKDKIKLFKMEPYNISSTEIREKIANGEDVSNHLHPAVNDYIIKNQLYKK